MSRVLLEPYFEAFGHDCWIDTEVLLNDLLTIRFGYIHMEKKSGCTRRCILELTPDIDLTQRKYLGLFEVLIQKKRYGNTDCFKATPVPTPNLPKNYVPMSSLVRHRSNSDQSGRWTASIDPVVNFLTIRVAPRFAFVLQRYGFSLMNEYEFAVARKRGEQDYEYD